MSLPSLEAAYIRWWMSLCSLSLGPTLSSYLTRFFCLFTTILVIGVMANASAAVTESPTSTTSMREAGVGLPPISVYDVFEAGAVRYELAQSTSRVTYTVAPGDTLLGIARRYSVSVADIRRWNNIKGDHIVIGQRLSIRTRSAAGSQERMTHEVRSGQTGGGIARQYRVSVDQLRRWNPDANLDRLRIGQRLTVYADVGDGAASSGSGARGSVASGTPARGRLSGGVELATGPGYRVRNTQRAYGMPATIDAIRTTYGKFAAHFAEETQAMVGDLSLPNGGRMTPHRSHQNGLDADIAYISADCIGGPCPLRTVGADQLDVVRQWYIFEDWLRLNLVEYIFVSYDLQKPLYEYAQARGASSDELRRWFQYPRGRNSSVGVIRHEPGHANHYHVRFRDQS